ncbi:hypothetical protein BKA66DRAFT_451929 [Pyrenochaeta sp. MPI-SDFR-AT-0127]|nr:hypothetical protein BKA66DRAFT_451929 [Pyrenochaeta sp. MPI-SDFR-AT-0127]
MSSIGQRIKHRLRKSRLSKTNDDYLDQQAQSNTNEPTILPPAVVLSQPEAQSEHTVTPRRTEAELEAITEKNQLDSPFLCLPGEVRNRIYHYAFGGHEIYAMPSGLRRFVCMGRPDDQFAWNLKPIAQIMAVHLPLVCRQIRSETGKYFAFKFNTFGSTMPEYFKLLMDSLTIEQMNRIEVVKMNHDDGPEHYNSYQMGLEVQYEALRTLRNLRLLVLRDFRAGDESARKATVRKFRRLARNHDLEVVVETVG